MTKIKRLISGVFSSQKTTPKRDIQSVIKRADAQVGRAVTRLSDR